MGSEMCIRDSIDTVSGDSTDYSAHIEEYRLDLSPGSHIISFKMEAATGDTWGIGLLKVNLQRMIPVAETKNIKEISSVMFNNFTGSLSVVPSSRLFLYSLLNFLITFDRLQFYYFHSQNLSLYSEILLKNIN